MVRSGGVIVSVMLNMNYELLLRLMLAPEVQLVFQVCVCVHRAAAPVAVSIC